MIYLLKSLKNIKFIYIDLIFKFAGNLFPLYMGAIILLIFDTSSLPKLFDALAFTIYSSTFLFSAMYLWYKNFNKEEDYNLLLFLVFLILGIIISFLYAGLFSDKIKPESNLQKPSLILFIFTSLVYIIYECVHYEKASNTNYKKENQKGYNKLNKEFDE